MKKLDTRRKLLFWGCMVFSSVALIASITEFVLLIKQPQIPVTSPSIIAIENARSGTTDWEIPNGLGSIGQIQAYTSVTSVLPGQKLTFYVSTQVENERYSINIYRLGWYKGLGGRLMAIQKGLVGRSQGYYSPIVHRLVKCSTCLIDTKMGLVDANWRSSYTFTIPYNWTTGVYLAKFIGNNNVQTYAPFDVRGNLHSSYIIITSDTTYQAYNIWGGYSLYETDNNNKSGLEEDSLQRAAKVSFNRPYLDGSGSGQVLFFEASAIHWLEQQGYDLSYASSQDLHEDAVQLLQHKAYLSIGHDEYWTKEMRDGVENARDHGVGLGFFGANISYWQMRFERDYAGNAERTIVCYKVLTAQHDLARDPLYGKDNARITSQWRDPVIDRPENAMIGIMYSSNTYVWHGFPWQLNTSSESPLLDGTGLKEGTQYGCNIVGYEWDHIFNNGATPAGLQVLAKSFTKSDYNEPGYSNTTYYIASSGALVFAAGSIYWTTALDNYRYFIEKPCIHHAAIIPEIQKLMVRVMNELVHHHTNH